MFITYRCADSWHSLQITDYRSLSWQLQLNYKVMATKLWLAMCSNYLLSTNQKSV